MIRRVVRTPGRRGPVWQMHVVHQGTELLFFGRSCVDLLARYRASRDAQRAGR